MDLATILGLIGGWAIVITAMAVGGGVGMFIDVASILIVVMGSCFVVLMKFSGKQFLGSMKLAARVFTVKKESIEELIQLAVEMSTTARKSGLLALESMEINNEFLKKGIQYVVDGLEPQVVQETLSKDLNETITRHVIGQKIFKALADVAPAMGMIGTLVGLVQMLANMDDPKSIGPSMAIALLTTLYGAMIANMLATPIADKLALRSQEEEQTKSLAIDAIMGIQAGQNPRLLEEMLKSYLPNHRRLTLGENGKNAEAESSDG